ncbi:MAG: cobalamin-dependent protein [Syntrophobacterales bacterium]|nr:cobalamin-dependent protein [Syntrophobacterales bacterium]
MKILLVSTNTLTDPYPTYPIGLDYVCRAIPAHHSVTVMDMNTSASDISQILISEKPDLVGLSIRNIDTTDADHQKSFTDVMAQLAAAIRSTIKTTIVLGGSGFTILPGEWMKLLDADYGVIGEGERFPLLLEHLERNHDPVNIAGIIKRGEEPLYPPPWDKPFPRGTFPHHPYTSFYLKHGGMLNLQTKRGCPFHCIYCTYPHIEGKTFRFTEPDDVAETALSLERAGARYLYITDSTFNGSYDHSLAVAESFIKKGVSIPWGGFFTPTAPPPDYYKTLARAGLRHVEFGTESLAEAMLASYQKPFDLTMVCKAHEKAAEAGLHVAHYLMAGGPGECEATIRETMANSFRLKKTVYFLFPGVRIYPHTPLFDLALEEGQITKDTNLLRPAFYWSSLIARHEAMAIIEAKAQGKRNWSVGLRAEKTAKVLARLYSRGHVGPLWEHLIME